jgi:hypothetical protein
VPKISLVLILKKVKSPPRSHDLNPIELVWTDLIQVVAKRLPKTIGQVVIAVKEYWKTLTPEKCSEFIDKLCDVIILLFSFINRGLRIFNSKFLSFIDCTQSC